MNLIIYKGQTMATYLEHLLQKFDSATLEVRELSRNDYTFNDVKNIVVICSSELEIFLKLAAVGTQKIWQAHAFTLGHLTHNDLATVRI